eukprot:jgi/Bigna1/143857/aug1.82_g18565
MRGKSRLHIEDVSSEDIQLVSKVSLECIDCVESLMTKANSIHAPYDLRDLSLTLAVLERQLFNYISDHLLKSRKFLPSSSHGTRASSLFGSRQERRTLKAAIRSAHEMLDDGHIPLICGGVASLLHNLKGALLETKGCINNMYRFFYATPRDAVFASSSVLVAAAGVWKLTGWLSVTLQVLSATRPARWEGPMSGPVRVQLHVRRDDKGWIAIAVYLWRRISNWLKRQAKIKAALSLLVAAWLVHRVMRWRSMAKLRACHKQLLLLQRIMNNVTFALDEARVRRARSYVELVAFPCKRLDLEPRCKPASRLLIESVAYPCDPYLHQYTHGRHYLLKKALDVLYSSTGVAFKVAGGRQWLALLIMQISGPYFLLHPKRASSYAAGVRQHMRPELFSGFCSNLLTMDIPFISQIGEALPNVPIIISEYSVAPEKPFPCALDEICITYEWVRAGGLGFIPSRVIVAGESAGANLIAALCVRYVGAHYPDLKIDTGGASHSHRLIAGGAKSQPPVKATLPDEIILGYPALNLGPSPSPSRALHMCDPVLPVAAGNLAKAYHKEDPDLLLNPQVSPIFTSDAVLSRFPPTSIMTGGMDILLDDAVDFHVRLRRNGVPGNFKIFRTLPHGFWSMGAFLPEANEAQLLAVEWVVAAVEARDSSRLNDSGSQQRKCEEKLI